VGHAGDLGDDNTREPSRRSLEFKDEWRGRICSSRLTVSSVNWSLTV
jgi:hypothetical protein